MKKIFVFTILFSTLVFAKMNVVVSIVPQKSFVEEIGKDLVNVEVMVNPGQNPHSYEPKPSQMKAIAKGDIYFYIGTEFENIWLEKFKSQNNKLNFIDSAKGIEKITMAEHHHHEDHDEEEHHDEETNHEDHDEHHHDGLDPHVWTSPSNVKIIAKNIFDALVENDSKNKQTYEKNYNLFIKKVEDTDKKIKEILSSISKDSTFLVFHPAWGYFAKEYNLEQVAVEVEGKEPKPKELAKILEEAREEKVKAIFAQPEFSDKSAKIIARELDIKVLKVSPLAQNWSENLIELAKAIANK